MRKKKIHYKKAGLQSVIHVGADLAAMTTARDSILAILTTDKAGDTAKVAAFDCLKHFTESPKNMTIQNCNFVGH